MGNSNINKWVVKERNVSICEECGGSMALWYNRQDQQYCVSCDYCPNEYFYTKNEVEWTGVMVKYKKEKKNEIKSN